MKKYIFLFLFSLIASQMEGYAKEKTINGILLVSSSEDINIKQTAVGFQVKDVNIPGGIEKLDRRFTPYYIGKEFNKDLALNLQKQITVYYRKRGYPFVVVAVPDQQMDEGTLVVVVHESKMDKVSSSGNNWSSEKSVTKNFTTKKGECLCMDQILNDIAWINRNRFLVAEPIFIPGDEPCTTSVDIKVKDRCPVRIFGGSDNSGTDFTGNVRFFAGATWGNAFWMGDILTYQFTTTNNYRKFYSHFGQYTMFLPWKHVFDCYGGYSEVLPDISGFTSSGVYTQASARYTIPFKPLYKVPIQELTFGFDYKNTNNNLNFVGEEALAVISQKIVIISQFMAGYTLAYANDRHEISFNLEGFYSPGQMFDHQGKDNFEALRASATNTYAYGRLTFTDIIKLACERSFSLTIRGQAASDTLLPSEQFGLGGYDTVRGYEEREFNADNAVCINAEIRSFYNTFRQKSSFRFLGFVDFGAGNNIHTLPEEKSSQYLLSVGVGARYYYNKYVSARADYGFKLHDTQFGSNDLGKFHAGVFVTF